MYCLDKLQREIAYFFNKDIRELPKVESLLAEAGYTQIRKGDEIIEIDSALGLESAIAAPRELDRPPVLSHPRDLQSTDSTSQNKRSGASVAQQVSLEILESKAGKDTPKSLESPTSPTATPRILETESTPPPKVDSNPAPSQPPQAQKLKEALQIPLTDDRGLQSLAFGRVGSDAEIMEQVLIPQARNAYRKGTSQNKLEVAARNTLKKHRQDLEQSLNITPIKEFGTNYAEHYHSGESAIQKLLLERNGQVAGAFHRKELGDIDLVWGNEKIGLQKIVEKHLDDFADFGSGEAGIINGLSEIVEKGKLITENGVNTIWYKNGDDYYLVGISKGFNKQGDNNWIITSYKKDKITNLQKEKVDKLFSSDAEVLSAQGKFNKLETLNSTTTDIIPQTPTQKSLFDTQETPAETPAQKVDSSVESTPPKDTLESTPPSTPTPPTSKGLFDEVDSSESKTKHEQSEQTKAILTPTEAREIIPKQIFNFDDNGYLLKELTRQEAESLSKDSREMLEYFNKVFDGIDSIKVKQHIKDTYTDAQKGYDHLRRVNSRIYEDILQEYLKNKFKHNQLAKNIDEYDEYVKEYYTKMMDNLKSLEKEKKIFKELERIDAIVKNENETPPPKVDSSVESHTKHQDYNTFNQSLKDAHDFFKANNKDAYNDKLFDDVIKVANALDIRFWYQPNAVYMAGSYTYRLNRIMLQSDNFSKENAKTMLHELIHSVTSRAIYAYDNKALREKLSKEQIEAITELKNLYKEVSENNADKVWQKMATFKDELENNKEGKLYGLKNEHEMLAELANPSFREFLKEQNIFSKIIEAMAKIFSYVKDKLTGESIKSTNAQSELETILYKIMDNYTNPHAFTNEMSEHFGSRNFVDTARYKEYIKDHKQKFDKDNGKSMFSFFDKMNHTTKNALSGRNSFIRHFLIRADFNDKDTKLVDEIRAKWTNANTRPENLIDLKTAENAHIFQAAAQAQENNIKDFVKEYYGVSYDEFNNAFNGVMKDKHFYEAKDWKYLGAFKGAIPSKETAFLLALKPYFTSGLYKLLNEADFNVIKDSLYRILQDENLTYRNKPINEWFAKEWVEQDVKALQESFQYKLEQIQKVDSSTPSFTYTTGEAKGIAELRKDLKQALEPSLNKEIVNKEQGLSGVITTEEVKKIMSSKAVAKSVANGFSRDEHIEVAKHIERLFTESKLLRSHKDYKENPNILQVHRFVKDIEVNGKEANALITLFEKMQGKNKIYTIELESLESTPLSTQAKSARAAVKAQSAAATPTEAAPIAKTDEQIVAQDSNALLESTMKKFNYDGRKAKDLLEWHKDSHPLTKDENGLPKVFYHGTSVDELFEVFSPRKDSTKWGFWFASGEDYADHYGKGKYGARQEPLKFSTFLKVKNPFDMTDDSNLEVLKKIMGKKEYETAAKEVDFNHDNGASKIYRILSYSPFDRYKDKARAFQNKLKKLGYDGIKEQDGVMIVFEPNQIKHIENRGVAGQYFYSSSPNIFHSNPHAGAGLLGGSVAGIEQDENGNITFSPEKFALGLLGGTGASIAISKAHKKFLQSKPQKIIPFINKQKYTEPRFEVTKELEKTYRNAQVTPKQSIQDTLGLSGIVKGDFIKLAQKHPEYFANPQEAKELCDYVFENAFIGLQASDKKQALIIAKLQDSNNDYGSVAFRVQNINGEHRIRSVMLMEQKQVDLKVENAKKLGEPIFHFW